MDRIATDDGVLDVGVKTQMMYIWVRVLVAEMPMRSDESVQGRLTDLSRDSFRK
jgi:hypothetical protein